MTRSRRSIGAFAALGALAAAFALTSPTIAGQGGRGAGQNGRGSERDDWNANAHGAGIFNCEFFCWARIKPTRWTFIGDIRVIRGCL